MIATIMPMSTNTTIATCNQIHIGDTDKSLPGTRATGAPARAPHYLSWE